MRHIRPFRGILSAVVLIPTDSVGIQIVIAIEWASVEVVAYSVSIGVIQEVGRARIADIADAIRVAVLLSGVRLARTVVTEVGGPVCITVARIAGSD